jgi:hypothetical protein
MSNKGYVYILENENIPSLVKIGFTNRHPKTRASELSNVTGVPGKWIVKKSWHIDDAEVWEKNIFSALSQYRKTGEFFSLDLADATAKITAFLSLSGVLDKNGFTKAELEEIAIAEATEKKFLESHRVKLISKKWEDEKDTAFKTAYSMASEELNVTLEELSNKENSNFYKIAAGLIVISYFVSWYLLLAFPFILNFMDKPVAATRHKLFEARAKYFYELRRNFFAKENVPYPFTDKEPV